MFRKTCVATKNHSIFGMLLRLGHRPAAANGTGHSGTVHSFAIQREPSRLVGTAVEVGERVVRFVAPSTTYWCQKDGERSGSGVHKCLSLPEKASRGSRSSERRSYQAGRCVRRASPIGRRRL